MTGGSADLLYRQKQYVIIAIQANVPHFLYVARGFAFMPELLAGARPIDNFTSGFSPRQ
jgi:hypothetical protein